MNILQVHMGKDTFLIREGTSDSKSIQEVYKGEYQHGKWFDIEEGEKWLDMGANIGAFTVWASKKGADVVAFEPDPQNFKMMKNNCKVNNIQTTMIEAGIIAGGESKGALSISKTKKFWRNSLHKDWGGGFVEVDLVNYKEFLSGDICIKMDIEGSEMDILEDMVKNNIVVKKLTFEWSFDVDKDLDRYRRVVTALKCMYGRVFARNYNEKYSEWQDNWFPPATNVFCIRDKD